MLRVLCLSFIGILTLGMLLFPAKARWVAGLRPLETPSVADLDTLPQLQEVRAGDFLDGRSKLEVEVPRDMTVDEFLRLNNIRFPHVREQIRKEKGDPLTDATILEKGETFVITLTPLQEL